jgi:hypothetical protein
LCRRRHHASDVQPLFSTRSLSDVFSVKSLTSSICGGHFITRLPFTYQKDFYRLNKNESFILFDLLFAFQTPAGMQKDEHRSLLTGFGKLFRAGVE